MASNYATPPTSDLGQEVTSALDRLRARERRNGAVDEPSGSSGGPRGLQGGNVRSLERDGGGGATAQSSAPQFYEDGTVPMDGWWTHPDLHRDAAIRRQRRDGAASKNAGDNAGIVKPRKIDDHLMVWVLVCFLIGVSGAGVSWLIGETAGREAALDVLNVKPAMEFRNLKLVDTRIRQGQSLTLSYTYDKREDCYPDKGEGEINFKFFKGANIDGWRPGLRSDEPPGINLPAINQIATPPLGPGTYDLGLRAIFVCRGERAAQIITLPALTFEVVP